MVKEIGNDPTRDLKTERLNDTAYACRQAGSLLAAVELGLFIAILIETG
jgi:hypothetical protein